MSFFTKKEETNSSEAEEVKESGVWGSQLSNALADARKSGMGSKTGVKAGTKGATKKDSGGNLSEQTKEQITKLFHPDAWRPIVKAPFALGQAMTGRDCWELSKAEEDTLATSTSTSMEYVAVTDPKWLAIGMCCTTWAIIFSDKFIRNAREAAKEAKDNPVIEPGVHAIK